MIHALLIACLAAGETTAQKQGPDAVLRRYDLSGILPTYDEGEVQEMLYASPGTSWVDPERTSPSDIYAWAQPEGVVELLNRLFLEEFEYEGRQLRLESESELLVLAPQALQDQVAQALAAFERVFSSTVELQVDILPLPADGPAPFGGACVVDAAQIANLPSNPVKPRETFQVRLSAGRTSIVDRMRSIPVVADYNVEIAQGAVIHDPVVAPAEVGTRLLLRGAPAADGLALSVFVLSAEAVSEEPQRIEAPLRAFTSSEQAQGQLFEAPHVYERLEIAFRSACFNTLLPAGKALVLTSSLDLTTTQGGGKSRQAILLRRLGGELPRFQRFSAPGGRRELLFANAEALHMPRLRNEGQLIGGNGEPALTEIPYLTGIGVPESGFLLEWVSERFSTWRSVGPWVVAAYDPAWDEGASVELEKLTQSGSSPSRLVDVELRALSRGVEAASWKLPLRVGTPAAAVVGISTSSLVDFDVEVAQFAAAADAEVYPQFSGLAFRGAAAAREGGGLSLELGAVAHLRRTAPRMVNLDGPYITSLEKTVCEKLHVEERLQAPPGAPAAIVLGDRAGDQGGTLSLSITLQ